MAFSLCAGLAAGAVYDCNNVLRGGVNESLRLINWSDIYPDGTVTYDGTNTQMITDIVLAAGSKQAYKFEGFNRSLKPKYELVKGTYTIGWKHSLEFVVFQIDYDTKMELTKLAHTKVVAVVENLDQDAGDENPYEVYGMHAGLTAPSGGIIRELESADTNGAFVISLETGEGAQEGHMPYSWFKTDLATTLTAVEVLDTPTA